MPVINMPIEETEQLIDRPAVFAVIEQVKNITHIPSDVLVTYVGQNGSTVQFEHETNPNAAPVKLASGRMITVEVEEQPDEGMFATVAGNRPEHIPDFRDPALGVELKPCYAGFDYVVSVTYRTPSRTEAIRWRNDARFKASQSRFVNMHVFEFMYQIPKGAMEVLRQIHKLREAKAGYGQDFDEYFTQGLTTKATQVSTVTGTHPEILIKEKQARVQGSFDFTFDPAKQDKNEGSGWEIHFTYTFSFNKPTEYSVRYPIVIHNQALDMKYIPQETMDTSEMDGKMSLSMDALHFMEASTVLKRQTRYEPIHYWPTFDKWIVRVPPPGQVVLASFLLGLEQDYQGPILNIHNLADYYIDSDVIEWIDKEEWKYLHLPHTSALQISLYRNEQLSAPQAISLNQNGDVLLLEKANARKRYRVVLSRAMKLNNCEARSLKRLARYPGAMQRVLEAIRPTTGEMHELLPHVNLAPFIQHGVPGGQTREQVIGGIVSMKTVMNQAIIVENINAPRSNFDSRSLFKPKQE